MATNMTQTFSFLYIIDGIKLLWKPGIRRFVLIPLCLNILLFGALLLVTSHYYHVLAAKLIHYLPHWLSWLTWILGLIFFIGFFIVFIFAFSTLSNLIGAPFNSLLSERVEWYLTGVTPTERTIRENLQDIPRILSRQMRILGYYLPRALIIFILAFVPVVQIVAAVLWFLFNAWYMTLQYIDYPADNARLPLSDMFMKIKKNRINSLGFGAGVLLLSMVPFLNFIVMPAAVAGATKFWIEQLKNI